jgi:hypothetical protein
MVALYRAFRSTSVQICFLLSCGYGLDCFRSSVKAQGAQLAQLLPPEKHPIICPNIETKPRIQRLRRHDLTKSHTAFLVKECGLVRIVVFLCLTLAKSTSVPALPSHFGRSYVGSTVSLISAGQVVQLHIIIMRSYIKYPMTGESLCITALSKII